MKLKENRMPLRNKVHLVNKYLGSLQHLNNQILLAFHQMEERVLEVLVKRQ